MLVPGLGEAAPVVVQARHPRCPRLDAVVRVGAVLGLEEESVGATGQGAREPPCQARGLGADDLLGQVAAKGLDAAVGQVLVQHQGRLTQDVAHRAVTQGEQRGEDVALVVATHQGGAGQPCGEPGGGEIGLQEPRAVQGPGGQEDAIGLEPAAVRALHPVHPARVPGVGHQGADLGPADQLDIGTGAGKEAGLGVALEPAHGREAVEVTRLLWVIEDAGVERHPQGLGAPLGVLAAQAGRDAGEVGLYRKLPHPEERLGLAVPGLQLLVAEGPGQAAMPGVRLHLMRGEAQQGGAVPLGLAPRVEVLLWEEGPTIAVQPGLFAQEVAAAKDPPWVQGAAIQRQRVPLLQHQDPAPGLGQAVGRGGPPGARADDQEVIALAHGNNPRYDP